MPSSKRRSVKKIFHPACERETLPEGPHSSMLSLQRHQTRGSFSTSLNTHTGSSCFPEAKEKRRPAGFRCP